MSRIFIVSSGYPYGNGEAFLHNEVKYLAQYFDELYIFPLQEPERYDVQGGLPVNVKVFKPFLPRSISNRLKGLLFSRAPIMPHLSELLVLMKTGRSGFIEKLRRWFIHLVITRIFFSSQTFSFIKGNLGSNDVLYFYWCRGPAHLAPLFGHEHTFIRCHGGELELDRYNGYIPFFKRVIDEKSIILAISEYCKGRVLTIKPKAEVVISRLGTYDQGMNPAASQRKDRIVIASCSSLIPLKRVHLIIQALGDIKSVDIRWLHFGDGNQMDRLKDLAGQILSDNVQYYFMGNVSNEELMNYYRSNHIDLFINVSLFEGLPVSLMEAMSFGIPCFATNVGGSGEIVNKTNGILVPRNFDTELLTRTILQSQSKIFLAKRHNARCDWRRNYDAHSNFGRLKDIFINQIA
ncbi:MAG: glycosyltransferase [Owenweeksia sp.]|nr:glycosyltransferase [Owenweeksia sp.]